MRAIAGQPKLATALIPRLPFFYGWVILAVVCCCGFARQGPAVATLSIFVEPMTGDFGWSRTALSGAVSLGGILAAVLSPAIGPMLDRHGARLMLCVAVGLTGISALMLSQIESLLAFYLFFCIARCNFAGPFDIGIYGALNSWFVAYRGIANAIVSLAQMLGLVIMPLIAHFAISGQGWRGGWLAVGTTVLLVALLPTWLLLVRRPEDAGLVPDGTPPAPLDGDGTGGGRPQLPEPSFSRREALRTPAFWLLSLYTVAVYPVQAGISLHQAPHLIEHGLSPAVAATTVSLFSLVAAISGLGFGFLARRAGVRILLSASGASLAVCALLMIGVAGPLQGYLSAASFGIGIGGILTLLPLAWADYFGRASFGAIRGVALSMQVAAQASGPMISGVLRDATGSYSASLSLFAALSALSAILALLIRAPRAPQATAAGRQHPML